MFLRTKGKPIEIQKKAKCQSWAVVVHTFNLSTREVEVEGSL